MQHLMRFTVSTQGHYDFINITDRVASYVASIGIASGAVAIYATGSTVGLTVMEWEEGVKEDLRNMLEKIAPEKADYAHHRRGLDTNGSAHIKSALMGTDLVIPIEQGKLQLGQWQQIVLIDFDERPREREVIVKVLVESER